MFSDIPLAGPALILGVDPDDECHAHRHHVIGNGVATMAIACWHNRRADPKREIQDLDPVRAVELPERVLT